MPKPEKMAPVGTCDYCGKGIPVGEWWTSKGRPRLHCSLECRQAANSRKMENRAEWMRERIESGDWVNPATINKPTSETISKNSRAARLREVEEGRWRNPGSTPEARAKNSEPHKHAGLLASAIEKMGHGVKLKELPEDEREAYHVYARQLRSARKDEINQQYRERYRRIKAAMTEEEKETQREKWRQAFSESQSRKASGFWNEEEYSDRREALIQHRISSWTDEKRAAVAERMTERMSDDGIRQMIGEKSKEAWARDNGERRKMQAAIMRENMTKHSITDEVLTDALRKAGSIRGAARILDCDRSVFRRFPDVLSKFKTNHKVLSVKELKGVHDVYCLTMPDTGNFALSAGVFVSNCGIVTNFTPLESGWEGFVTIEISNTTPVPVKVYANEGVAQCLFFGGEFPLVTYADRKGKYQAQTGITLAKV